MIKSLKPCREYTLPKIGEFAPGVHPLVKFVWREIVDRRVQVGSVADAAGIDRSTLQKWRKSVKGPYVWQIEEVLNALGYELRAVKMGAEND